MDAYLSGIKSAWLLASLWVTVYLLAALQRESSGVLADALGLIGFFLCCLAYPIVLVFASPATNASFGLRLFVGTSLGALCGAMGVLLGPLGDSADNHLPSAVGIVAVLCTQLGAALALARAERRFGLPGGALSALSGLFFFPVLGFLVHRRHVALVQRANAA